MQELNKRHADTNSELKLMADFINSSAPLPNVKDEPRPWLARRVPHDDLDSAVSFRQLVR